MARNVKSRIELWNAGMFPVMTGKDYCREEGACVPLALVLPHEKQAQRNHSQTLHRLAERGGLSACELAAVLEDREWTPIEEHEGWAAIFRAAAQCAQTEELRIEPIVENGSRYTTPHHEAEVRKHWEYLVRTWSEATFRTDTSQEIARVINDAINLSRGVRRYMAAIQSPQLLSEETEDSVGDWQCKDFADGWITFPTRKAAEKYQKDTGALMRYRRFYPAEQRTPQLHTRQEKS